MNDDDRWAEDLAAAKGMVNGAILGCVLWFLFWLFVL